MDMQYGALKPVLAHERVNSLETLIIRGMGFRSIETGVGFRSVETEVVGEEVVVGEDEVGCLFLLS